MGKEKYAQEDRDLGWKTHTPIIHSLNERVDSTMNLFILAESTLGNVKQVYLSLRALYQKNSEYFANDRDIIKKTLDEVRLKVNDVQYLKILAEKKYVDDNKLYVSLKIYEQKRLDRLDKIFTLMNVHFTQGNLFPKPQITKIEVQEDMYKGGSL